MTTFDKRSLLLLATLLLIFFISALVYNRTAIAQINTSPIIIEPYNGHACPAGTYLQEMAIAIQNDGTIISINGPNRFCVRNQAISINSGIPIRQDHKVLTGDPGSMKGPTFRSITITDLPQADQVCLERIKSALKLSEQFLPAQFKNSIFMPLPGSGYTFNDHWIMQDTPETPESLRLRADKLEAENKRQEQRDKDAETIRKTLKECVN